MHVNTLIAVDYDRKIALINRDYIYIKDNWLYKLDFYSYL